MAKDPVCGMNVDENKAEWNAAHKGKTYYFYSTTCNERFEKEPNEACTGLRWYLHFFGEIRRSTLLRSSSFGGSVVAFIHGLSLLRRSSFGCEGRAGGVVCEAG